MIMYYSPLRYPGGKSKIAPLIEKIIIRNNLEGCTFVEPFAGGAGVALDLLFNNLVKIAKKPKSFSFGMNSLLT